MSVWDHCRTLAGGSLLAAALLLAPGGVSVVQAGEPASQKMVIKGAFENAVEAETCEVDPNPTATALRKQKLTQERMRAAMEKAQAEGRIKPLNSRGYNYAVNNQQKAQLLQLQREVHEARIKAETGK